MMNQPQPKFFFSNWFKFYPLKFKVDIGFVVIVITLLLFGLLMVFSASWNYTLMEGDTAGSQLLKQVQWVLIGTVLAVGLSRVDYHWVQHFALPFIGISLALLILVLAIGETRYGSSRTLFSGSVQPSELAKLVIVIYLSVWINSKGNLLNNVKIGFIPLIIILGLTGGLIIIEPDLSAGLTIFILGGLLFFLAGGDFKQITIMLLMSLLVGFLLINLTTTGQDRWNQFQLTLYNPAKAHDHIRFSFMAIMRGGIFGVGLGNGQSKLYHILPLPYTDSIFSVIAEELGLLGVILLIVLYSIFLWRGVHIARKAPDRFGRLLASGITCWITLEALMNMAVLVGLMPFTGNALPFISAGGSHITTTLIGIGLVLSVSQASNEPKSETERSPLDAVVDLRRWNGGRGLSRTDRITGA